MEENKEETKTEEEVFTDEDIATLRAIVAEKRGDGQADAGQSLVKKEETPKEYKDRVMSGKI